ncbi:hypothetical protein BD779DRAFT_1802748 [Infundibulicybe gibba]|nr:hypothetical protein BD779DRAFT_1802748 [Infundibulicybe gibba]
MTDITDSPPPSNPTSSTERFKALAEEFSVLVVIATFTATLITSFLSLARDIMNPASIASIHFYEIGMLLSLFATGLQLGTVLVAGRGAALSFREAAEHADLQPQDTHPEQPGSPSLNGSASQPPPSITLKEFRQYFFLCEQLQLFGTFLFFSSILFFTFFMFDDHRYPIIFYVVCLAGAYIVFRTGFWKISALRMDIQLLICMLPDCLGRGPKKILVDSDV